MNVAKKLSEEKWKGENDISLFDRYFCIDDSSIWQDFYNLHKNQIKVKKESSAVAKLELIITQTFRLSDKKGFALMSLRELSDATQLSMGGLYSYIGSKTQLAEMIHQFLPYVFDLKIGQLLGQNQSSLQRLAVFIRGHIFISERLQPWFFFAFMETKHLNESTKKIAINNQRKSETILRDILLQGEQENLIHTHTPLLSVMMIKNMLQNWYVKHSIYVNSDVDCEEYVRFIEEIIDNHLGIIK